MAIRTTKRERGYTVWHRGYEPRHYYADHSADYSDTISPSMIGCMPITTISNPPSVMKKKEQAPIRGWLDACVEKYFGFMSCEDGTPVFGFEPEQATQRESQTRHFDQLIKDLSLEDEIKEIIKNLKK